MVHLGPKQDEGVSGDLGEMAYHGNHGMVDTKWYYKLLSVLSLE